MHREYQFCLCYCVPVLQPIRARIIATKGMLFISLLLKNFKRLRAAKLPSAKSILAHSSSPGDREKRMNSGGKIIFMYPPLESRIDFK